MKIFKFLSWGFLFLGFGVCTAQYNVLLNFDTANGEHPNGSLRLYASKLYGMTALGGVYNAGCIFRIDTNGTGYKDLFDFDITNGGYPSADLTIFGNKMYGMSSAGLNGFGNIFSIDTNGGNYKDLLDFNDTNGAAPMGDLTLSGEKLYGMTSGNTNSGNIFSIDTNGSGFKSLFDFNFTNGSEPYGSLTLSGGTLYGMTLTGGPYRYDGDIFSIDTNGSGFTVMHYFNDTDGANPFGSLALSGNTLFGLAHIGGVDTSRGCIFSINTNGTDFTPLHYFTNRDSGWFPTGSLTISGGTLYGFANGGGDLEDGCVFRIDTDGEEFRDLFYFNGYDGGGQPGGIDTRWGSLLLHGNSIYGMTSYGGTDDIGVVFELDTNAIASINNLKAIPNGITIFPNPSNGTFTIESPVIDYTLIVTNILGQRLFTQKIQEEKAEINLAMVANGMYFIQEQYDKGIATQKLIITKNK